MGTRILAAIVRTHIFVYRLTGGRIGGRWGKAPILLLTTTGRRTGKPHTTPLLYLRDAGRLIVVATNDGAARHPSWYVNLQKRPLATVQARGRTLEAEASTLQGQERADLWTRLVRIYTNYERDQRRAGRELPVVALERRPT